MKKKIILTLLIVFGISELLANNAFAGQIIAEYTGGAEGGSAIQGIVPEGGVGYGVLSSGDALVQGDLEVTGAIPEYPNLARLAEVDVIASSFYNNDYAPTNINDGLYGRWDVGEWGSLHGGQSGVDNLPQWIQLNLSEPQNVNVIVIYSRPNRYDVIWDYWVQVGRIDSNGDEEYTVFTEVSGVIYPGIHGGKFPDGAAPVKLLLTPEEGTNIDFVRVRITETAPTTYNIGLAEIELYYNPNLWE